MIEEKCYAYTSNGWGRFISSHIVNRLVRDGYRVRVVDNLSSGRLENIKHHLDAGSVELIVGDLKDPQVALKAVEGVDVVFHFVANPEVRVSYSKESMQSRATRSRT